ncbi:hypothetical protein MTO96_003300 [Rhipicephalus appendiculatus]
MAAPRGTACSQTYSGCNFFRQRLVLSTLSSKPIEIKNIRHKDEEPGLRKFEVDLLKLLEKVTNGTGVEINETGTCRSVGYYLEALLCLAPFCKKPLDVTLTGVTHHPLDPSVDALKHASLPVLGRFIFTEGP